jgi:hypothetical protein
MFDNVKKGEGKLPDALSKGGKEKDDIFEVIKRIFGI